MRAPFIDTRLKLGGAGAAPGVDCNADPGNPCSLAIAPVPLSHGGRAGLRTATAGAHP